MVLQFHFTKIIKTITRRNGAAGQEWREEEKEKETLESRKLPQIHEKWTAFKKIWFSQSWKNTNRPRKSKIHQKWKWKSNEKLPKKMILQFRPLRKGLGILQNPRWQLRYVILKKTRNWIWVWIIRNFTKIQTICKLHPWVSGQ